MTASGPGSAPGAAGIDPVVMAAAVRTWLPPGNTPNEGFRPPG